MKQRLEELEKEYEDMNLNIETDIKAILHAYDFEDTKIHLEENGLTIDIPVKLYNDNRIINPIPTDFFTQMNKIIGLEGSMNIPNAKIGGNHVYLIELIYSI